MDDDKFENPDHEEPDYRDEPEDDPYDEPLGELPRSVRNRLEALIPEMVKKTFAAGLGAVFTTEEGIRRMAKDLSLPKDVAGYLATTAGSTKDEIIRIIAREVHDFLNTINLSEEIAKMLTTLSFEIKTEIRFIPNNEKYAGAVKPDVRANVRLRKTEDERPTGRRRRRRRRRRDDEGTEGAEAAEAAEAGAQEHRNRGVTDADVE